MEAVGQDAVPRIFRSSDAGGTWPEEGYSLGDWNTKWEAMARRATDGDYLINGERTAQLKMKLDDPQVSIRDVMGDDFNPDEE